MKAIENNDSNNKEASQISNQFNYSKKSQTFMKGSGQNRPWLQAIEEYKKYYTKTNVPCNNNFQSCLKQDSLNIYVDNYNIKELQIVTKLIGSYYYFRQIIFGGYDSSSKYYFKLEINSMANPKQQKTEKSKNKGEEDEKEKESDIRAKEYSLSQGIAKNLFMSENVQSFKILNLKLRADLVEFLSEGIANNKSLKQVTVNNCTINYEIFENLIKGLLTHEKVEFLDFSNNNLNDKSGNIIGRIISRQSQRRDQVVWMYGLRNELPAGNDYTKGLISINLSKNQMGDVAAEEIANALSNDNYVRALYLNNNQITIFGCKKLIKALRQNQTVLNLDLKNNPGFEADESINKRLVIKLSNNLKNLQNKHLQGVYSNSEFEYLKQFANFENFDVEIPDHVIDFYHNQIVEMRQDELNQEYANDNKKYSLQQRRKMSKEKKRFSSTKPKAKQSNTDESEREKDKEIYSIQELDEEEFQHNYSDSEAQPIPTQANKRLSRLYNKLKENNQLLNMENLELKKQIVMMRAQLIMNPEIKCILYINYSRLQ